VTSADDIVGTRKVADKSNEITAFIPLLSPLDLTGFVITADAMQTQRANARFLRQTKNAHFIFPVLDNQPTLFDRLDALHWKDVAITARTEDHDRGRHEVRTIQVLHTPEDLCFPHVAQVLLIERTVTENGRTSYQAMLYVTSLDADQASPVDLLAYVRGHWSIEVLHWIRDVTYREDASHARPGRWSALLRPTPPQDRAGAFPRTRPKQAARAVQVVGCSTVFPFTAAACLPVRLQVACTRCVRSSRGEVPDAAVWWTR
jgi:predicted transposase YbfD/YdcC